MTSNCLPILGVVLVEVIEIDGNDVPVVLELRGQLVMLAGHVARAFDVDTRQVVQNIKNNPEKLPPKYAFELTGDEVEILRSLGMISKPGRGGSRALPWVLTQKGIIRLATIMVSPRALEATDLVIDIFSDIMIQLHRGANQVQLENPSRLLPSPEDTEAAQKFRAQIAKAIENLLNTTIDPKLGTTVREELGDIGATALTYFKENMRTKKISNEKIEAEALLIVEQARDIFERRQADLAGAQLDQERQALENFEKKIDIIERLLAMRARMEPDALLDLLPRFFGARKATTE